MFWKNIFKLSEKEDDLSRGENLISFDSNMLGILDDEEDDIFSYLLKRFITNTFSIDEKGTRTLSEHYNKQKKELKGSQFYCELQEFVRQFQDSYNSEDVLKLSDIFKNAGFQLTNDELMKLIIEEYWMQSYEIFKSILVKRKPKNFNECLFSFSEVFGKKIKLLDDFKIAIAILEKNEDMNDLNEQLATKYIDQSLFEVDLYNNEDNSDMGVFKSVALKARYINFLKKFLIEQKLINEDNLLNIEELVNSIIDMSIKLQSDRDALSVEWMQILKPESNYSCCTFDPNYYYRETYEKVKLFDADGYLVNFVKKFGANYSDKEAQNLTDLYQEKSVYFTERELEAIIGLEIGEQEYEIFKKVFEGINISTLDYLIVVFVKHFNDKFDKLESLYASVKEAEYVQEVDGSITIIDDPLEMEITILQNELLEHLILLKRFAIERRLLLISPYIDSFENHMFIKRVFHLKKQVDKESFAKSLRSNQSYSLEDVDLLDGFSFETLLKKLFVNMGYIVEHTKLTGDQGADLVISRMGVEIVIQAKRYANSVGNKAIQEIVAAIAYYQADKGMVITNNTFTNSARELAGVNSIELLDRNKLEKLIEEYL